MRNRGARIALSFHGHSLRMAVCACVGVALVAHAFAVRADDADDVRTCANWSADDAMPLFPMDEGAQSNGFTGTLPLAAWSSSENGTGWYLNLSDTNVARTVPVAKWFDRAYAVEALVRLPSQSNSLFAGTFRSLMEEDRRGFFLTMNGRESRAFSGKIAGGLQRGGYHTRAVAETGWGFVKPGQWYHVLVVKTPRHVRLWVNGTLVASHKMVMQYSYVYPQKDFQPRIFRLEGDAEIGFIRLYDGWIHRPEAEALYARARDEHAGFGLPAAPRRHPWMYLAVVLACLACLLCAVIGGLKRLWPRVELLREGQALARLGEWLNEVAARPAVVFWNARGRTVLLGLLVAVVSIHEWVKLGEPTGEYDNEVLWGDYMNTDVAARDLAAGYGFRELRLQESVFPRNPLHALHVAVVYTVFGSGGEDEYVHRVSGAAATIVACVVLFELLLGLFGPLPAFLGVVLFHNTFGMATQNLLSETTAVVLLALQFQVTVLAVRRRSPPAAALAGLLAGASVLVRSYFAVVWVPAALWFAWRALWDRPGRRTWLAAVLLFTLLFILPSALYGVRNGAVKGEFSIAATYQMVDPWGQHCGDTPIDFHAWQLFKWPDEQTARRMIRHELWSHVRDYPGEFIAAWRAGIRWICIANMPGGLKRLWPFALPAAVLYVVACSAVRARPLSRLQAEAVVVMSAALLLTMVVLASGHISGFPETVPRYWHPVTLCLGALLMALVAWVPCGGWTNVVPEARDRRTVRVAAAGTAVYLAVLLGCMVVWLVRGQAAGFPVTCGTDWWGFARGVLANEGRLSSNVVMTATGTLSYPTRTRAGMQADLLVRSREFPAGEIRLRLQMTKELVPLAGLDPRSVWGRGVRVTGVPLPTAGPNDNSNNVFAAFAMEVGKMELLGGAEDLLDPALPGRGWMGLPLPVSSTEGAVFLMDVQPTIVTGIQRGLVLGSTYDLQPVIVQGKYYPRSISMHPLPEGRCYVQYALAGKYSSFSSMVWVASIGNAKFMVYGDGRLLCETPYIQPTNLHICPMPQTNLPMEIGADIRGCTNLQLEVDKGYHHYSDHAVWGDPRVLP